MRISPFCFSEPQIKPTYADPPICITINWVLVLDNLMCGRISECDLLISTDNHFDSSSCSILSRVVSFYEYFFFYCCVSFDGQCLFRYCCATASETFWLDGVSSTQDNIGVRPWNRVFRVRKRIVIDVTRGRLVKVNVGIEV